ncbi:MAG TPA: polysaccharide deacetylase family protein [Thermoleophilaceae bacterium]|nr:polysaccharide deacetylase family protein [Thermoleophilaceae bacterium]
MRSTILPVAAGATAAWSFPALAPVVPAVARALALPRTLDGSGPTLTFDDGPHPEGTPAVLDALGDVRAIFFLVGEQVERHPSLAAEIAAAGHTIASHGHRHVNQLRRLDVPDDLDRAHDAIARATGREPALYRPPYGIFSWPGLRAARERYDVLLWSRWGHDWRARATPGSIAAEVTEDLTPADVLLLHDSDAYSAPGSHRRTAAALPRVLEEVQSGR